MSDPKNRQSVPDVKSGYGVFFSPVRWHPYKPTSQEVKRGKLGRWQMMNEYGGWHNCEAPSHIVQDPQAIIEALK